MLVDALMSKVFVSPRNLKWLNENSSTCIRYASGVSIQIWLWQKFQPICHASLSYLLQYILVYLLINSVYFKYIIWSMFHRVREWILKIENVWFSQITHENWEKKLIESKSIWNVCPDSWVQLDLTQRLIQNKSEIWR